MKYVITGGAGNISKPLVEKLLNDGHEVTVIGRNEEHLQELKSKGAKTAIGSIEDVDFLKTAFAGADAVYTMVPPVYHAHDWKEYIGEIGKNYAAAIAANNIKYVVNLSSVGAHLADGCGPVSGLHREENELNKLTDVAVKHLRPGYFYINLFSNLEPARHMEIMGSNFKSDANNKLVMAHPDDIAAIAAEELEKLDFKGHTVRYIASDERTTDDIAKVLGTAIGKPNIPWIVFSNDQTLEAMKTGGLPDEVANNYIEMGNAIQSGIMMEDYWKNRPATLAPTKLETFATTFADIYNLN